MRGRIANREKVRVRKYQFQNGKLTFLVVDYECEMKREGAKKKKKKKMMMKRKKKKRKRKKKKRMVCITKLPTIDEIFSNL